MKVFVRFLYPQSGRDGPGVKIFAGHRGDITKAPKQTYKLLGQVISMFDAGGTSPRSTAGFPTKILEVTQLILNKQLKNQRVQPNSFQDAEQNTSGVTRNGAATTLYNDKTMDRASQHLGQLSVEPRDGSPFTTPHEETEPAQTADFLPRSKGKRRASPLTSTPAGSDTEVEEDFEFEMSNSTRLDIDQVRQKAFVVEDRIARRRQHLHGIEHESHRRIAWETKAHEERIRLEKKRHGERLAYETHRIEKARRKYARLETMKDRIKDDLYELVTKQPSEPEDDVELYFGRD
ncbi:hypothetical protein K491DRAFT_687806 [Lophiostoma macrostomum CBS 122681]|uniref:Uncharacterized protein n=1 Tax=Lophiostoma macrostomum CBS 122681 TaxID=1314788 RepID=A0A6A6TLP7_9PLEO|nr:hypothetical protein K491DRAFT_687806 [Lophiostoma macrostomum CBS 122681]